MPTTIPWEQRKIKGQRSSEIRQIDEQFSSEAAARAHVRDFASKIAQKSTKRLKEILKRNEVSGFKFNPTMKVLDYTVKPVEPGNPKSKYVVLFRPVTTYVPLNKLKAVQNKVLTRVPTGEYTPYMKERIPEKLLPKIKAQRMKPSIQNLSLGSYTKNISCKKLGLEHMYENKGTYDKCRRCGSSRTHKDKVLDKLMSSNTYQNEMKRIADKLDKL